MSKKLIINTIVLLLLITNIHISYYKQTNAKTVNEEKIKIGMVTAAGNINDQSFNQSMWEGIEKASKEFNLEVTYIKPTEPIESEFGRAISNLIDNGYNLIVTPGTIFAKTVLEAQEKYKNTNFILVDIIPSPGGIAAGKTKLGTNTISLIFAENEAGFLAGVATALQIKEGDAGFIGGKEVLPVQKYNWGFQQGIKYANDNFGTNVVIKPENIRYLSLFSDIEGARKLTSEMYNRGVKVIFAAAGNAVVGVIEEAKKRAALGNDVWVVGVDRDQYDIGIYFGKKSVILTSAIKAMDKIIYNIIKETVESGFKGGRTLRLDSKNEGVGIPGINPNLSEDTIKRVQEVYGKIKSGEIKINEEQDGLID